MLCIGLFSIAQNRQTENIILITFDGLRWQEMFGGADSVLINDSIYTANRKETNKKFRAATAEERRKNCFLSYGAPWRSRDNCTATAATTTK